MKDLDDRFSGIVGQQKAKRKLKFHLENFDATKILPHLLFIAPKGCGKTTLAKAVGRNLMSSEPTTRTIINEFGDKTILETPAGKAPKRFLEVNCSSIKSVPQFVEGLLRDGILNKEVTVLFDEASELPKDVTMFLLSVLNPNTNNFNSVPYGDGVFDFDFRKQTFMFATTEAHKIFHALVDRCDRIDMEEYSLDELATIVQQNLANDKRKASAEVLKEVSSILRGNARAAQKMANNIKNYLARAKKEELEAEDWRLLKHNLGIMPLGLNDIEIQIMRALRERKTCSLTNLAAKVGLTTECIRRDFEMYLQKHDLMTIATGGRALSQRGHEYLKFNVDKIK